MFLLGNLIAFIKPRQMPQVRVTSCKDRRPPPKSCSVESDGYVYTLEYNDPSKPTRYVILWDYAEDLFKPDPSCDFVNPECLDYMNEKAKRDGNKGYNAVDQIHLMAKFPPRKGPAPYTNEQLTPDELEAIQAFEIEGAKAFQKEKGYWPLGLEIALPRCNSFLQTRPNTKLAHG